jgi:hypothetical protein
VRCLHSSAESAAARVQLLTRWAEGEAIVSAHCAPNQRGLQLGGPSSSGDAPADNSAPQPISVGCTQVRTQSCSQASLSLLQQSRTQTRIRNCGGNACPRTGAAKSAATLGVLEAVPDGGGSGFDASSRAERRIEWHGVAPAAGSPSTCPGALSLFLDAVAHRTCLARSHHRLRPTTDILSPCTRTRPRPRTTWTHMGAHTQAPAAAGHA